MTSLHALLNPTTTDLTFLHLLLHPSSCTPVPKESVLFHLIGSSSPALQRCKFPVIPFSHMPFLPIARSFQDNTNLLQCFLCIFWITLFCGGGFWCQLRSTQNQPRRPLSDSMLLERLNAYTSLQIFSLHKGNSQLIKVILVSKSSLMNQWANTRVTNRAMSKRMTQKQLYWWKLTPA